MKNTVSTTDARKNFTAIINKVENEQESIILTRKRRDIEVNALAEPGDNIPAEEVWKNLGL